MEIISLADRMSAIINQLRGELKQEQKDALLDELSELVVSEEGRIILTSVSEKPADMTWGQWYKDLVENK